MRTDPQEMGLLDLLRVLWRGRYMVAGLTTASVILAAVVSALLPEVYEARAVILPVQQDESMFGPKAVMAAQVGLSLPSSSKEPEVVSLLRSNVLKARVIKEYDLLPVLFKREFLEDKTDAEQTWAGIRHLKKAMTVELDRQENTLQLTLRHKDPEGAADILNHFLDELTEHMTQEARRVAETNREYLESLIEETSDPLIRTKIYTLIADQIETAMLAQVKENFAFKVIDPPMAPDEKSGPRGLLYVSAAFLVSLLFGVAAAFSREYLDEARKEGHQDDRDH